jgi:hypothetical protein
MLKTMKIDDAEVLSGTITPLLATSADVKREGPSVNLDAIAEEVERRISTTNSSASNSPRWDFDGPGARLACFEPSSTTFADAGLPKPEKTAMACSSSSFDWAEFLQENLPDTQAKLSGRKRCNMDSHPQDNISRRIPRLGWSLAIRVDPLYMQLNLQQFLRAIECVDVDVSGDDITGWYRPGKQEFQSQSCRFRLTTMDSSADERVGDGIRIECTRATGDTMVYHELLTKIGGHVQTMSEKNTIL